MRVGGKYLVDNLIINRWTTWKAEAFFHYRHSKLILLNNSSMEEVSSSPKSPSAPSSPPDTTWDPLEEFITFEI